MTYRIRAYRNTDWPDSYAWPWTAALEEWNADDDDFDTLDHGDGDSYGEAVAHLREVNRLAVGVEVDIAP